MKQQKPNTFISRAAAMLLTVIIAFAGAQTAGATEVVTYTISHIIDEHYIYYFNGSDGSSQVLYDGKGARPKNITLEMGSDVTFNVTSPSGTDEISFNYTTKAEDISMFGFRDYFNTSNFVFTFTSKSRYITHIQIDGRGYVGSQKAKTTMEAYNSSKTCTVNWEGGSGTNRMGAPGKFIVTYETNITYNINYVLNGGTNASGNPTTYVVDEGVASLAAPTRTGYTFGGWYDNAGFQGDAVTSIPTTATGDVTLYAKWTANTYTVAYDANGGSGTMDSQTFTYDAAQNLRTNTFTNTGKLFDGWKDNNNNSYSDSQSVSNLTATNGATVTLYAQWKDDPGYITGSGTASDPCVISTKDQWDAFATESNHATYWASGKHIKLGANISGVTTTVGTQTHPFQGTFDGQGYTLAVTISETSTQGTAPFREISGATIKRLTVTGSVTGTTHAAGLVGFSRSGTNTIEDCNVSANVTVNTGSNKHCGGLVGHAVTSTLTIRNSIYSGIISSGSNYAGGLQGWSDGNTLNIENSLFSGSYQGGGTFHPIAIRNGNATMSGTINGAYYTATPTLTNTAYIAAQGTQAYASRQSFPCKSVTILGNTVYYAADLTPFGKTSSYTPDGTDSMPYIISTTEGWNYLCDALQDNDTWNRFSGKTVRLGANIEVNRMAGSQYHDFCGIFDGQQYTLTFNYGTADSYANDEYAAPFHFVSTVTPEGGSEIPVEIKNLHVAGHIYTSAKYAAGLIAQHWGTVNVENCRVSTVIHSSVNGDGTHGGFEAECKGVLNITGCVFDGKLLTTNGTDNCGGFVGWHYGGTTNISNSLYAPAAIAADETEVGPGTAGQNPSATFGRNAVNSIANSYYTRTLGTAQGKQAHSITAGEGVTLGHDGAATEYSVSGITAYKASDASGDNDPFIDGLVYNEVLYAGDGEAVSLTLSADAPEGYVLTGFAASAGTLSGNDTDGYTLDMRNADVTVSASFLRLYNVTFTERGWNGSAVTETTRTESAQAVPAEGDMTQGWYYLNSDVTVNGRINLTGDANLILGDDCTLDVKGIYIPQGSTLTIYAQSDGLNAGRIVSHPTSGAAIGGMTDSDNGNIVICGGIIEATGYDHCAGIGSADGRTGGTITIYGGTVTAKGGTYGAAIGGGRNCSGGTIDIYGGDITANGPTDTDTCENGAGIGGGEEGNGGNITIYGGNITTYSRDGAGIGGGDEGAGGTITINGGTITSNKVNQGQGARIGGGLDAGPGTITINGGTITTEGGSGAGIGGGKRNLANGTVTINGGVIDASGSYGIGAGENGADVAITLGWTSADDCITASTYNGTVTIADGKSFHNGSEVLAPGTVAASDYESKLNGKTLIGVDVLQDDAANDVAALATRLGGKQTNIALSGRTLYKDGAWNTLVLPFAIDDFTGTPLEGATVKELNATTSNLNNGTLTLNFSDNLTAIEAGTPYIVKWAKADGYDEADPEARDVKNPVFTGVTISGTEPTPVTFTGGSFVGQYSTFKIGDVSEGDDGNLNEIIMLSSGNKLGYSQNPRTLHSFRAHFYVPAVAGAPAMNSFVIDFGDESTSLREISNEKLVISNYDYYTLDGRKLNGKPTQKGVYVNNGKKIVIK